MEKRSCYPVIKFHMQILIFLDYFFFVFHTILITFNLVGWCFVKTRKLHLASMLLTLFSWVVIGYFYGWGYCFCTDWHWQVRIRLGHYEMPNSYIKFLIDSFLGTDVDTMLVDTATTMIFIFLWAIALIINIRDYRRKKRVK